MTSERLGRRLNPGSLPPSRNTSPSGWRAKPSLGSVLIEQIDTAPDPLRSPSLLNIDLKRDELSPEEAIKWQVSFFFHLLDH